MAGVIACSVQTEIQQKCRRRCSFGLASPHLVYFLPWWTACSALELRHAVEGKSAHTVPRWPYDFIGPVLKDRPRNLTCVGVLG